MRRQLLIAGGIILGAALLAFALISLVSEPEAAEPNDQAPLVQTANIEFGSGALPVLGGGTVRPRERVSLAPQVGGRVTYVSPNLVKGRRVTAGELLIRIDGSDFRNAVEQARADVAQQSVTVTQAREEVRIAQRELDRFREREDRAAAALPTGVDDNDYAARILPPVGLAEQGGGAVLTGRAPTELATRRPQLRAAQAALARAQAQLANARTNLSRTEIRAPFSGIVASEQVGPGSFANPGQAVAELVSTGAYEVEVPLSANDAALLPGLFQGARYPAEVTYDFGGRRYRWEAYVDRADGLLNDETRTIDVYLRVPRPISGGALAADQGPAAKTERNGGSRTKAPPLLVGSFVGVSISGETRARYAIVPLSALRSDDRIWAVRDGKVAILDVSVIQRDDNFAYLEGAGIPANAKLITGGIDIATNGMKVRVASKQNGSAKSRKASPAAGAPRE